MADVYKSDLSITLVQAATIQISGDELLKLISMLDKARCSASLSEEQRKTASNLYTKLTLNC